MPLAVVNLFRWAAGLLAVLMFPTLAALFLLIHYHRRLRLRYDQLLREKEVMFNFVHDVGEVFAESDSVNVDALLQRVLHYALRTTHASAGAIHLLDSNGRELQVRAIAGVFPPIVRHADLALDAAHSRSQAVERAVRAQTAKKGEGLLGEIADFGGPVLVADAERDPRIPRYDADFLRVRSLLAVPMRFRHRIMGTLTVVNRVDNRPFTESDMNLLQALADQASVSAHYSILHQDLDAKKRMDRDLSVARRIQQMLLPRRIPSAPGLEVAAFNVPALEIGGDYYDVVKVDDARVGVAIADVSGKGIGGALLMSVYRSVLRATAPGCDSPARTLREINRVLRDDLYEDMFVTALYGVYDPRTRELRMARAGHDPAIVRSAAAGAPMARIESDGVAIGLADPADFDAAITETAVTLQPGDLIALYTDGITEAQNAQGEEWGLERLLEALRAAPVGAEAALNHVRERLMAFVGDSPPYDDMTMIMLQVLE